MLRIGDLNHYSHYLFLSVLNIPDNINILSAYYNLTRQYLLCVSNLFGIYVLLFYIPGVLIFYLYHLLLLVILMQSQDSLLSHLCIWTNIF